MKTFKLISSYDGLLLEGIQVDATACKGVVVIVHGMSEYKERYLHFMNYLETFGFSSLIIDHRGHGNSIKNKDDYGYFYDDKGDAVVDDLVQVVRYTKEIYESVPLYIFAHSMGTLVTRAFLQENDSLVDGVFLCGPPNNNPLVNAGLLLSKSISQLKGDHYRSTMIQNLSFKSFEKQHKGKSKNAWINSVDAEVDFYDKEEKCGFIFTVNGFQNLFHLVKRVYNTKAYKCKHPQLPIHLLAGKEDPVIGGIVAFEKQAYFLQQIGYEQVTHTLYEGKRHELLNESNKAEVMIEIVKFLEMWLNS